jgi:parallel beta-helix repeat protein
MLLVPFIPHGGGGGGVNTKNRVMSIAICLLMITSISSSITQNAGQSSPSSSGIIYVDDDNTSGIEDGSLAHPFNTIQEGVDAATSGDKVYVFNGTYYEHISISKSHLILQGENRNTTTIDGGGSGDVVGITVDWVNVSGFRIVNGINGISLSYSSYSTITGNNISSNNWCGINALGFGNNNAITSNNILSNGVGIFYQMSSNNIIANNRVSLNHNFSIQLCTSSDNNIITGNNISSNDKWGIWLVDSSNNNIITGNNISSNGYVGITLHKSSNNDIILNNVFLNGLHGIELIESLDNDIAFNNISSNGYPGDTNLWWGISLRSSLNTSITDNNFYRDGVFISGEIVSHYNSHNIPANNIVNGKPLYYHKDSSSINIHGIPIGELILANCTDIDIRNLQIDNTDVGIEVAFSTDTIITNNNVSNNWYGIFFYASSNNSIKCNDISANYRGFTLSTSSNYNIIRSNNILSNEWGIRITDCSNNYIYHNNILNNTNQAYDNTNMGNQWDNGYPSGGNYWSDYNGSDFYNGPNQDIPGSDGIGDTPHPIFGGFNQDNYPLMKIWVFYNQRPIADAGADQIVNEGDTVQFNGSSSHDPEGTIESYEWDFDSSDGLWWETGAVPDATGPTPIHIYGDDGIYNVTLRVTDNYNLSAVDTCNVTVQNVDPTVTIESITMDIEIGLRVAGRKYNNVSMALYEDGSQLGYISIERMPGSPDEQMAWIPISINFSRSYNATVTYTPEDPPNVGGNPVWIYLKSQNGSIKKIHHTFNVQQSKKRDSEHWNHIEPWEVDLNEHFIGLSFEITSHITDPGSDDETLTFTYGSQVVTITYLNNPPNPDPYPSPEVKPVDIMVTTTLVYEGPGTVTLVVKDDDNIRLGVGEGIDSIDIG